REAAVSAGSLRERRRPRWRGCRRRRRSRTGLEPKRIVHPQRELGVTEVLRFVDVVEEVVDAAARDRRPAAGESPAERRGHPGRDGEEALVGQLRVILERARQIQERDPHAERYGPALADREVAPERCAPGRLEEPLRN